MQMPELLVVDSMTHLPYLWLAVTVASLTLHPDDC